MDKIKVTLKNYTPLDIAIDAIRTCWDSGCKKDSYYENGNYIIGNQDKALLNRIIHQHKHHSTIEHLHLSFYIEGISRACYDDKTEVLTSNGFKLFKDLTNGDLIATRNWNGTVEFQKPYDYIEYDYKGLMHHYKNQVTDCLVTPNHRMMYKKVNVRTNKDNIYYMKSEDINVNQIKFLKTMNFIHKSNIPEVIKIPFSSYYRKNRNGEEYLVDKNDLEIKKNEFLDLLAMYISDGITTYIKSENKYAICITKPYKKDLIKHIVSNAGLHPVNNKDGIRIYSRHLGVYFKNLGLSYQKYIPLNVYDFSKEDAIRFLDCYSKFNGYKRKNSEVYTITTTSKKLKEQLYLLCLIAGYYPTISITDRVGKHSTIKSSEPKVNHILYSISYSKKMFRNIETTIKLSKHRKISEYNGKVYCVSVPNGNLFVRRNNKGMWCGNCLQELVRHRIASYSVESTRYTLKKHLRKEEEFNSLRDLDRASKYVVLTKDMDINAKILDNLNNLLELVKLDKSNDTIKYALPEAFRTNLAFSINMRSLMNFIELRTSKAALKEIRILAMNIFQSLPYIYKEVFFPELLKSELYAEMKEENINEINNTIKEIEKGDK
ncbi:FAD-dependent thymidylate synthase [Campylobacter coli]|nr:FAD-dependent thymidylate synthase [Campylobacter coli]